MPSSIVLPELCPSSLRACCYRPGFCESFIGNLGVIGSFAGEVGIALCLYLLHVHGDIYGITRSLGDGKAKIQCPNDGVPEHQDDDDSLHLIGRPLTFRVALEGHHTDEEK